MRVALRADASDEIGTGHVMRQFALAEALLARGAHVYLVGEIRGLAWLEEKLASLPNLQLLRQPRGTFETQVIEDLGVSVSTIDSYSLGQSELERWESRIGKTFVFIDGPWQQLSGRRAVAPTIAARSSWLKELRRRFDSVSAGPDFMMIRNEIKRAKQQMLRNPASVSQILVVLGGATSRVPNAVIEEVISRFTSVSRVVVMCDQNFPESPGSTLPASQKITYASRADYSRELTRSTLVVSAAGTSAAELLFLGVPSIFIPLADNQFQNARALEEMDGSTVVWPDSVDFEDRLTSVIGEALSHQISRNPVDVTGSIVDGFGSCRVATMLLG